MDAGEQLKEDLREGRIDANRLVDLLLSLQRELQTAKQRIAELEKQLAGSTPAKIDEPFSMRAEEKRQEARGKKKRKATILRVHSRAVHESGGHAVGGTRKFGRRARCRRLTAKIAELKEHIAGLEAQLVAAEV